MTSVLDQLHDDIVRNPEDDTPRLAYATACENVDAPRSEFIRAQIAETHALRDDRRDAAREAFKRWFSLERRFRDQWGAPVRDRVRSFSFYRGFVEWIEVDARQFLDHAEELYALAPVRRLKLVSVAPVLDSVCRSAHLARLVSLSFSDEPIGDAGVQLIAASSYVNRIARLTLFNTGITRASVEALAASTNLSSLRVIDGLPDGFREDEWWDQGQTINVVPPPEAPSIEAKYGYQRWLHPLQETHWRGIDDSAL